MKVIRKSLILFYDKSGKILIQDRRNYKAGKAFGFFGGSIEKAETPEQAIVREVKEELSLDLTEFKLVKEFKEIDKEKDLIYWIFASPLPNLKDIICNEGKPYFTDLEEVFSLDLSDRDKSILKEVIQHLKSS